MRDTLRLMTCGSADAGKSTLIGRLLWESKQVFEGQPSSLAKDCTRNGEQGEAMDLALLVGRLRTEGEQSNSIDAASYSFATARRRFVVADIPAHEQYTRDVATEASASELAVLVVNASKGLQAEAYRDAWIVAMLGVRHLVMAVNKMDLADWDEDVFSRMVQELRPLVDALGFKSFQPIPVSALNGDNITTHSPIAPWYAGPTLLACLEEIDVARGDILASASDPAELSDQFEARVLCLSEHGLLAGRSYLFHLHTCQAAATITAIKYQVDVRLGMRIAARSLGLNDIGVVNLSIDRPVPFEPHDRCRHLGSFILTDRLSDRTVGVGIIDFALRRAANIHWQAMDIDKDARARQKLQKPICLWLTGLSASGKSTIANLLEKRLFAAGRHTYTLDGDNVRHGLNRDLGFSEADRVENIRRVTEVARLLVDAGLVTIVSFISPYRAEREIARSHFQPGEFLEIFVDAPLEECERRDPKGLYAKARRGDLINFTGIDSAYEPPDSPEIQLDTVACSAEECVDRILFAMDASPLHESTGTVAAS